MHILLLILMLLSALVWGVVHIQRETRRRQWAKQNTTPLMTIEGPRELVATLALGFLKCGGEITSEQKDRLIEALQTQLDYNEKNAGEMYSYASYLVGTDPNYTEKLSEICAPALDKFTPHQRDILLDLLGKLVERPTDAQRTYLERVQSIFALQ